MKPNDTTGRRWLLPGVALLVSLVILAGLGMASVRWEARARAAELGSRMQWEAEELVAAIENELRELVDAEVAGKGGGENEWIPEPGRDDEVYARYLAGDYQWVVGSGSGHRTPAGLPVQALAALQLVRSEAEPDRLEELCVVLWEAGGFLVPTLLEEAEQRHRDLGLSFPAVLDGWRGRWEIKRARLLLQEELGLAGDGRFPKRWVRFEGDEWLVGSGGGEDGPLMLPLDWVRLAVATASRGVVFPKGTATSIAVAGRLVQVPETGGRVLAQAGEEVRVAVRVQNERMLGQSGMSRWRGMILGGMTATAVVIGVLGAWLAYGAYRRARDFAERQGNFVAAVSHEMRTPLASMTLLADNLEREVLEDPGERKEHARLILQEMKRLSAMVERVLTFSQPAAGIDADSIEDVDPDELLERARDAVSPLAEAREVRVELAIDEFESPPRGHAELLLEAAVNLLDNAVKHSSSGGSVRAGAKSERESWLLWVEDDGEGVPERERERVFERFYRIGSELRRERPGSGLGLALVRQTAERHGGTACCVAGNGGGGALRDEASARRQSRPERRGAMRVLVIEDELPMRTALVPLLTKEGYRVECAEDGPDGLRRALDEHYALILLDVMLPGLDGFALCRELRRRGREVPVLMMTARGQVEDRVARLDGGADDYLVKPFRSEELLARIRALLRRAEVRAAKRPARIVLSGAVIDFDKRTAERDGEAIPLRPREIAMLEVLAEAAGGVVSREEFLDRLWPSDAWPSPRTVDNHILSLRSKLEPDDPRHILTVHRTGYRLEADETEMTDRRQLSDE